SARAGWPRGAPRRWRWRSRSSCPGTVPLARRPVVGLIADLTARQDDPPSSSRMTPGSFARTTRYGYPHVTLPGMPAALRTRLPALIAAAVLIEFYVELAVLVPEGTAYRGIAALLLAAIAAGLAVGPRAPLVGVLMVYGGIAALSSLSPAY